MYSKGIDHVISLEPPEDECTLGADNGSEVADGIPVGCVLQPPPPLPPQPLWRLMLAQSWSRAHQWVEPSTKSVSTFLNDTLLYIVSRHWIDLLSIQLLRLHPLPFCELKRSHLPCTPEASAKTAFNITFG